MDLSALATNDRTWRRAEVQKALGVNGFEGYAEAWLEWWGYDNPTLIRSFNEYICCSQVNESVL